MAEYDDEWNERGDENGPRNPLVTFVVQVEAYTYECIYEHRIVSLVSFKAATHVRCSSRALRAVSTHSWVNGLDPGVGGTGMAR